MTNNAHKYRSDAPRWPVLVIDDERSFDFADRYARTSDEAILMLASEAQEGWWSVWFDHDLGGDDTAMRVVEVMERWHHDDALPPIRTVYVHSMNPVGAQRLMKALSRIHDNVQRVSLPQEVMTHAI